MVGDHLTDCLQATYLTFLFSTSIIPSLKFPILYQTEYVFYSFPLPRPSKVLFIFQCNISSVKTPHLPKKNILIYHNVESVVS